MRKVSVIGHFGFGFDFYDGQTIKTKIINQALQEQYGKDQVLEVDTHGGLKKVLKALFQVRYAFKNAHNIIMLPARNGLRIFGRLLPIYKRRFPNRRIHYIVIGGWLPEFLQKNKSMLRQLKHFDGIYVETNSMQQKLKACGIERVFVLPNCKYLDIISREELVFDCKEPYKLCTFSRVMREKGIEDAVNAVRIVNEKYGSTLYTLDIYGQIDPNQQDWFNQLQETFPSYVRYMGCVAFDKSVAVLKNYYTLLFPTYYEGEGFAGTLLDAMAAGVPVIASDWKYNCEIVNDRVGWIYKAKDLDALVAQIEALTPDVVYDKKISVIQTALQYTPKQAVGVLFESLI